MKTNYDDFTKLPVTKMAQSMAEIVEDSVAINLLNTYFKTLKTLYDENSKWFMEALLCIDMKIKPSTIKSEEYQAQN